MRVAFIIQDMFARGAQYVTARMVEGFINRGFDVDLIVSQYHNKLLSEGNTNFFKVPQKAKWIYLRHLHARNNIIDIRHYLKTTDSLAVFSMSTGYTHALRMALIGLRKHPKLVHVEHFLAGYDDLGREADSPHRYSLATLWRSWYWNGFDRVFTVTKEGAEDFRRMNPWYARANIRVVNNPAIEDSFWSRMQTGARHPWLSGKDSGWKTFVAAGAFVESKGYVYLINAIKRLASHGEKIRAVIFGQGQLEAEYRRVIAANHLEDYVSIGGYTNNLPAELANAHGYVNTSLVESFGITIVEALAAGCKVVSFDCPFGPKEILENGKYGRLVPVGDAQALALAMSAAATEARMPLPSEAWNRYSTEATVDKYLAGIE